MSLRNTKTGFSVKDLLDLPDTNDEGSGAEETDEDTTEETTGANAQSLPESARQLSLGALCMTSGSQCTRWLTSGNASVHYRCKYIFLVPEQYFLSFVWVFVFHV